MSATRQERQQEPAPHHPGNPGNAPQRPYWQRAHRDWKFWVGLVLMLAAMMIYVVTNNLALRPGRPPQRQMPALASP
jgi:hypothetical protein